MNATPLKARLEQAKACLEGIERTLNGAPWKVPPDVEGEIREILRRAEEVNDWLHLLDAREYAFGALSRLEKDADPEKQTVKWDGNEVQFTVARLLAVQAYLSSNWALSDCITSYVGRLVCGEAVAKNSASPAKLEMQFVRDGKTTSSPLFTFSRECFGWPIAVSYAIRNLFLHDGGARDGWRFFEGPTVQSGFRVSESGWNYILEQAKGNQKSALERSHTRVQGDCWSRPDDLRELFKICQREMDEALSVLLGSSCALLRTHVGLLLGQE